MISGIILIHEQPVLLGEAGTYRYRRRHVVGGDFHLLMAL